MKEDWLPFLIYYLLFLFLYAVSTLLFQSAQGFDYASDVLEALCGRKKTVRDSKFVASRIHKWALATEKELS